jgi:hypothetical protein
MASRVLTVVFVGALAAAGCGGSSSSGVVPASPTAPSSPTTTARGLAGTWVGQASDSSGTMMGAGMTPAMMGNMTWEVTQTGNTFTGVMRFPGFPGHGSMTVTGTIDGNTARFTMTMPGGGMMGMMGATCTATATGTFDVDAFFAEMHGTYAGTTLCGGHFDRGRISMARR